MELTDYIRKNFLAGKEEQTIKDMLSRSGIPQTKINDAIRFVKKTLPKKRGPDYADFLARLSAYGWDSVILGIPSFAVGLTLFLVFRKWYLVLATFFILALIIIYMEGRKGGTPGKLITGLRITNERQESVGLKIASYRFILRFVSLLILYIGFIMIIKDTKKQGLHDRVSKTFVIEIEEKKEQIRLGLLVVGVQVIGLLVALFVGIVALLLSYIAEK